MIDSLAVVLCALAYLSALFAVAHYADRSGQRLMTGSSRAKIYAFALAIYCTSWTFYGSVGFAHRSGFDFLAIYLGPVLVMGFGWRYVARIVDLAKSQNITSVADFLAARYGKSERVAALVSIIVVIGALPYISLQLKAITSSLTVMLQAGAVHVTGLNAAEYAVFGDLTLLVGLVLAAFAMAFGTRHVDATEHQNGLVIAIALESLVKLIAFIAVGVFVTYWLFDGAGDLFARHAQTFGRESLVMRTSGPAHFLTLTVLSAAAILLLPRQFHMTVVENRSLTDVRRAAWMFPIYLIGINLFVIPIMMAGDLLLTTPGVDRDMTVLALPLQANAGGMALLAFLGGLSAATAMVIVESIALSIMISNHLVMPLLVRRRSGAGEFGATLILVRRLSIGGVILLGYIYYRSAGEAELASIGLLSFAAVAQVAPSFLGGLAWRRGTARGALWGMSTGFLIWSYSLLLPSFASSNPATSLAAQIIANGPFGISWLKPTALFGSDIPRLTHGVFWSLTINALTYMLGSLLKRGSALERLQASLFVGVDGAPIADSLRLWGGSVTVEDLRATVARYLGQERTQRAFDGFARARGMSPVANAEADVHILRFSEHLLASAIGAASSRLALSLLLKRRNVSSKDALKLLDDASAAIQYSRDMLQHALDHAGQGITVIDPQRRIMAWNQAFLDLYDLNTDIVCVGESLEEVIRYNAMRGSYGPGDTQEHIESRLDSFITDKGPVRIKLHPRGRVIELRTNHLPDGGLVTTYTDITDAVVAEETLERANETLERRVRARTEELMRVNTDLARAKAQAEDANASKTRFLAAASHDILQPLNAARLYATALVESDRRARTDAGASSDEAPPSLAENVDASLDAVEEILTALLDISRLDAGAMRPQISMFSIDELLRQLVREFEPLAAEKDLKLVLVRSSLTVRSDRRLLRRMLQNLISNAIKYTPSGTVLVGIRRRRNKARIQVMDTGLGIPGSKHKLVFQEFERLDQGARVARGLGLGLSIVERISRVLSHPIGLQSSLGKGSVFSVDVPSTAKLPDVETVTTPPQGTMATLGGMTLLVIDNEAAILDGMNVLMTGWGCEVLLAKSLKQARQALKRRDTRLPDVIIADYHLDDGDGLDAIVALRWTLGSEMPAILLTADRSPEVREAALARDVHILNKPLKPAALRALLAQWRATRLAAE
jgi:Na+/proline symporter/signal transduction histidine kinase/CheY-like chemotaxis protein